MGMDVYGLNPKYNEVNEDNFKVYLKYSAMELEDKWKAFGEDEKLKEQYWKEQEAYEDINPGNYFRNNVWWWRPLWHYVCQVCDDILTSEDMDGCTDNSGYKICEEKALIIGVRLHAFILDGSTQKWKEGYDKELSELSKEPCFRCDGNNRGHNKKKECLQCDKTGERENFQANYPFDVENVKNFAKFCIESGGFEVC